MFGLGWWKAGKSQHDRYLISQSQPWAVEGMEKPLAAPVPHQLRHYASSRCNAPGIRRYRLLLLCRTGCRPSANMPQSGPRPTSKTPHGAHIPKDTCFRTPHRHWELPAAGFRKQVLIYLWHITIKNACQQTFYIFAIRFPSGSTNHPAIW